jgi:hypothetical protein
MVTMRKNDLDDDDDVVRDGESVTVPIAMMDVQQRRFAVNPTNHKAHYAELSGEVRAIRSATRARYLAGLRDAWRRPGRDAAQPDNNSPTEPMRRHLEPDQPEPDADVDDQARRKAYENFKTRLSNAYKTDPRAANAIEQQGERWRGGR